MTPQRIAELRAALRNHADHEAETVKRGLHAYGPDSAMRFIDIDFIKFARTALPEALDRIERLTSERDQWRAESKKHTLCAQCCAVIFRD